MCSIICNVKGTRIPILINECMLESSSQNSLSISALGTLGFKNTPCLIKEVMMLLTKTELINPRWIIYYHSGPHEKTAWRGAFSLSINRESWGNESCSAFTRCQLYAFVPCIFSNFWWWAWCPCLELVMGVVVAMIAQDLGDEGIDQIPWAYSKSKFCAHAADLALSEYWHTQYQVNHSSHPDLPNRDCLC